MKKIYEKLPPSSSYSFEKFENYSAEKLEDIGYVYFKGARSKRYEDLILKIGHASEMYDSDQSVYFDLEYDEKIDL
jgi:hypothetical protein